MARMLEQYVHSIPGIVGLVYYSLMPHVVFWAVLILCAHVGMRLRVAYVVAAFMAVMVMVAVLLSIMSRLHI